MMFMENLKETLMETNKSVTENGAVGYKSSGTNLVDINFAVSSMRNMSEKAIVDKFVKAFYEDKLLAVKWLFFVRDAREGVGERRLFRICMEYLAQSQVEIAKAVIPFVPEYGRFDDWFCMFGTDLEDDVIAQINVQLKQDWNDMETGKAISLLAKWMPSANTSSENTKRMARKIIKKLDITERQYRKMLAKMRAYLDVVEVNMSKNEWSAINYSAVPSRANLIYNKAFLRNDEARRREFLELVKTGETKVNAGVLFPHDIVHKYMLNSYQVRTDADDGLETAWAALPDFVKNAGNTICVSDGSGSMTIKVGGTSISALEVAISLSIYFAERSSGQFKDKYITFSRNPRFVELGQGKNLREKIEIARGYCEIANTNIEAVFDLILKTAVKYRMKQSELPANILILSDMEFDYCAENRSQAMFETFSERYRKCGYELPRLVFWNINSRTLTVPVRKNKEGVALVSGFSPAVMKIVLSSKTDPFECLAEQLNSERYDAIEKALAGIC